MTLLTAYYCVLAGKIWLIDRGHFVDIKYDQQRLYAVNKDNRTIQVYSILEACCPYTGNATDRFLFSRLTGYFVRLKDAWVTFAACDQLSMGRYVARDVTKVYMSPWHEVVRQTDRRAARWAGCGRLEAPTPAAMSW